MRYLLSVGNPVIRVIEGNGLYDVVAGREGIRTNEKIHNGGLIVCTFRGCKA